MYILELWQDRTLLRQELPMLFHSGRCSDNQTDPVNHANTQRSLTKVSSTAVESHANVKQGSKHNIN